MAEDLSPSCWEYCSYQLQVEIFYSEEIHLAQDHTPFLEQLHPMTDGCVHIKVQPPCPNVGQF